MKGHRFVQASVRSVVSTALPKKCVAAGIHEAGKKEAVGNHKRGQSAVRTPFKDALHHLSLSPNPSSHSFLRGTSRWAEDVSTMSTCTSTHFSFLLDVRVKKRERARRSAERVVKRTHSLRIKKMRFLT